MCFSNHVLYRDTDPNILEWSTMDGNKIPQNILDEVKEKSMNNQRQSNKSKKKDGGWPAYFS